MRVVLVMLMLAAGIAFAAPSPTDEPRGRSGYRLETVVAPSFFHGVHGMAVAPNGDVYAGDIIGQTVWRIPAKTRVPEPFIPAPFGMADDVAIGPDGRLVWTSILTGVLYEQRPGGRPHALATELPGINSVGFSPDGRLYASQLWGADKLFVLDGRDPPRLLMEHNGGLNGFQINGRGVMYAPQGTLKRVVRLDLATMKLEVLATGFVWPTGVKLDSRGRIFVVDLTAGTLSHVATDGTIEHLAQLPPNIDNLAIDRDDKILVSSPGNNTIYRVDPETRAIERWIAGRLSVPGGVAVDTKGRVLVADTFAFKAVEPYTVTLHELGLRPGYPLVTGMNVHTCEGRTTLSNWYESSVRVLDAEGLVTELLIQDLAKPQDAVALPDGSLLIAETAGHRLSRVAPGASRAEPFLTGFEAPTGLTCARDGVVYVTDVSAGTITEVGLADRHRRLVMKDLKRPEGIVLAADSALYVAEVGTRRLLRIPTNGQGRKTVADLPASLDPPPGVPLPWVITGVALDVEGRLYVSSPLTTALYAIDPPHRKKGAR